MANKFLSNINLTAGLETDGDSGSAGQILSSTGTGVEWTNPSGGIGGSGTTNKLTKWVNGTTVGAGLITDDGTTITLSTSGNSNTFDLLHTSGSGRTLNITKGGNGEGIYVNKTSGSGNAIGTNGVIAASGGNSTEWNTAYDWGNHANAGYLTSFTETDPTVPSHVKSITTTNISNWNTAYDWGNHSGKYMLEGLTLSNINTITNGGNRYDPSVDNPTNEHYAVLTYGNRGNVTGQLATHFQTGELYSRGHNNSWSTWRKYWNTGDFSQSSVNNWNTAFNWGNHAGLYANASHNHDDRYYTESESDSRFVNVTGDTITGTLTISGADAENALTISGTSPTMAFTDTGSEDDFYIHVNSNNFYVLRDSAGGGAYGNWTSPSPLRLEGDTNTGYLFDSRMFADNYHPNADKWTTARTLSLTGDVSGSVSWDGSGNASITTVVANNSHTHTWANINGETANSVNGWGGLRHQTNDGYIDFGPANANHAHIYTDRSNFYLNKSIQVLGVSIMNQNDIRSKIFYDVDNTGYYLHPASTSNFNTLNVSTINRNPVVTLSGDVTGAATMTNLGSINITTTVNNDSHAHSFIQAGGAGPSTEDLNSVANSVSVGQLSYRGYNSSSTNKPPAADNANGVITVGQHNGNYNAQLAFSSNGNMYWRDNPGSTNGSWRTIWDSGNGGSGSGLHADLLDGLHSTGFVRIGEPVFNSQKVDTTTGPIEFIRDYNNGWDDYIIKHSSARGLFGKHGVGWHSHTNSSFHVFSSGWLSNFGVNSDGTTESRGSSRAPIFYDSNNTSYYLDPTTSGTSAVLRGNIRIEKGNSTGTAIEINSVRDSTWPFEFTTNDVGNDNQSGFWVGSNGYPDMRLRRENSTVRALISSWERSYTTYGLTDSTDMRAPIFYDSNNTGYYGNFASNSRYNTAQGNYLGLGTAANTSGGYRLNMGGSIDMNANGIDYLSQLHFQDNVRFLDNGNDSELIFRGGDASSVYMTFQTGTTTRGSFYANSGNNIGVLDSGGNWAIRHSNDYGTYFSTNGETNEFTVGANAVTGSYGTVQTSTKRNGWGGYSINGQYVLMSDHGSAVGIYNDIDNEWMTIWYRNAGADLYYNGTKQAETESGYFLATNQMRSPIYYDSNNTGYYLNPASTSRLNGLTVDSTISGNINGSANRASHLMTNYIGGQQTNPQTYFNGGIGLKVAMTGVPNVWSDTLWINGYAGSDVRNMNALHFRRDGTPRMYISTQLTNATSYGTMYQVLSNYGGEGTYSTTGDFRAPIFYDNNNTTYYLDPSSTGTSMKVAGNVGIGTTNPQAKLEVNGTIRVHDSGDTVFEADGSTGSFTLGDIEELADGALITGNSSEIRITHLGNTTLVADGNHRVGIGTDNPTSKLHVAGDLTSGTIPLVTIDADWNGVYGARSAVINGVDYGNGVSFYRNGTYDGTACSFYNGSSKVGSIGISTSSTFYNTSSDYRLKENVVGISDGIERLKLLKPSRFNFIGETAVVDGFIAHEAQSVIPEAVTGEKDGELPNGEPEYQGIDQSKIVPLLTAALQEAIQKIEQLETRITQLENNN